MQVKFNMKFTEEEFKRLRQQDPAIFTKLYTMYKDKIYTYLSIKTKYDKSVIFDILSDTFFSAYKSVPGLKENQNIYNWLLTIANRRFNDYLRKKFREDKHQTAIQNEIDPIDYSDHVVDDILEKEKKLLIRSALDNLKPEYRDVLKMKYIYEKTQKEISESMNKTVKSVEALLFKGRKALKKEMQKLSEEYSIG